MKTGAAGQGMLKAGRPSTNVTVCEPCFARCERPILAMSPCRGEDLAGQTSPFNLHKDKALRRGVFRTVPDLIGKIEDNIQHINEHPKPLVWTAAADSILEKVARGSVAPQTIKQWQDSPSRQSCRDGRARHQRDPRRFPCRGPPWQPASAAGRWRVQNTRRKAHRRSRHLPHHGGRRRSNVPNSRPQRRCQAHGAGLAAGVECGP